MEEDYAEIMRARLQADLRAAMKARAALEGSTLRCLIAAIDNAGSVAVKAEAKRDWSKSSTYVATNSGLSPTEVVRRTLSSSDVSALIEREWRAREVAAITLETHGRSATDVRSEMAIIEYYKVQQFGGSEMSDTDTTFSAQEAVAVQRELRRALGLDAEAFPLPAFVGMISDEIEQFRGAGKSNEDIAAVIKSTTDRDVSPEDLAQFYAPPEERRGGGHG